MPVSGGAQERIHLLGDDLRQRAISRGCPVDKPHALDQSGDRRCFFVRDTPKVIEPVGSAARPFRILSIGRLEWKKGYEYALQAARRCFFSEGGIHFEYRIMGDGEFHTATAYARYQLGLASDVEIAWGASAGTVCAVNSNGRTSSCTRRLRRDSGMR